MKAKSIVKNKTSSKKKEKESTQMKSISSRLTEIMRGHIGKDNAIKSYDLFVKVYNERPEDLDPFKAIYMMNFIKSELKRLRREDTIFTVFNYQRFFVLQTKQEAKRVRKSCDHAIKGLKLLKTRANRWVSNDRWRKF